MDIAILKSSVAIPYLTMGNNQNTQVGQDVIAVGTPLSLNFTHTFTKGIVSAINRTIKFPTTTGEVLMQNLIQHDASLNPGNSGGPLINGEGQVIGINTLKISTAEGLGFAIPISSVSSLVNSIYNNFNYEIPFLGVYGYDANLTNNFTALFGNGGGFYVDSVADNSPASLVGIVSGDIIVKLNGVTIGNALDFRQELFKLSALDKLSVQLIRNGKTISYHVTLVANPYHNKISNLVI